jgi:hypothetical protein
MKDSVEGIVKITLTVGGKEMEFTLSEMRQLREIIESILGRTDPIYPNPIQPSPWPGDWWPPIITSKAIWDDVCLR